MADASAPSRTRGDAGGRALDARGVVWPPLPAASREIDAVAATFPRSETWKGALASERLLRERNLGGALTAYEGGADGWKWKANGQA